MNNLLPIALLACPMIALSATVAGLLTGLRLQRLGCETRPRFGPTEASQQAVTARIEIADLRTRMKRLEAIAAGIDL